MPQNIVLVGGLLSEPQLLAVGYAYEQAANARVAPDLDATIPSCIPNWIRMIHAG